MIKISLFRTYFFDIYMVRKTHKEFSRDFNLKNSHADSIEVICKYIKLNQKIKCRCKMHDHIWYSRPNDLLNG